MFSSTSLIFRHSFELSFFILYSKIYVNKRRSLSIHRRGIVVTVSNGHHHHITDTKSTILALHYVHFSPVISRWTSCWTTHQSPRAAAVVPPPATIHDGTIAWISVVISIFAGERHVVRKCNTVQVDRVDGVSAVSSTY